MKCKDCKKKITKDDMAVVHVMDKGSELTSFKVCQECAAVYKLCSILAEQIGEDELIRMLEEILNERK
jgi:hypothetical protein